MGEARQLKSEGAKHHEHGSVRESQASQGRTGTDFNIDSYIPYRLVFTQQLMHQVAKPESEANGTGGNALSRSEARVLAILYIGIANSPSDIADAAILDRAAVTRLIASLTNKKLTKAAKDAGDRRRKMLGLTRRGRQAAARIVGNMEKFGAYLSASLTAAEQKNLFATLDKLNAACRDYPI